MKPIGPLAVRILLYVLGTYVILGALTQCMSFNVSEKALQKDFAQSKIKPALYEYEALERTLQFAKIGSDSLPMVVFVHGSPGSWSAYLNYFKDTALTQRACLVSVDRPGFGGSGPGYAEPSIKTQAAMIMPILRTSKSKHRPILVGHSLGGPIIARMAMDYPAEVGSLIFLAPSIDPGMEKKETYRKLLKLGIVQSIMPPEMVASNLELMPLKGELDKMLPFWKNIKIPCTIIHGTADVLVPYGNVAFYEKQLVNAPLKEVVRLENVNHFIPWSHYDTVKAKILEHLKR